MSLETLDWDTLSLRMDGSLSRATINQKNLKETGLNTAVDLRDLHILRFACKTKNGLVNARFRSRIWPILAGVDDDANVVDDWRILPVHRDEDQVMLDVQRTRCLSRLGVSPQDVTRYRERLNAIIVKFLRLNPQLSYYQGFHDICSLFLTIFEGDCELAYPTLAMFSLCHLRDFLMPDLTMSTQILHLVPDLVRAIDPVLHEDLMLAKMKPFFCLSPLITLLTHDIKDERTLSLVFDQILCSGSIAMVVYIYVALMINRQNDYLEKIKMMELEDMFSKQDLVHNALSKFLADVTQDHIEEAIKDAYIYSLKYPLDNLNSFKDINKFSVLKTTSTFYPESTPCDELIHQRVASDFDELVQRQVELNTRQKASKQASFLTRVLSNRKSQQLIKVSLTVGILSVVINLLLSKHTNDHQWIGPAIYQRNWVEFTCHSLRPLLKEVLGFPP